MLVTNYLVGYFDVFFFFQAEDGIRDLVRSRGLGDVYKRQAPENGRIGRVPRATVPSRLDIQFLHRGCVRSANTLSLIHI